MQAGYKLEIHNPTNQMLGLDGGIAVPGGNKQVIDAAVVTDIANSLRWAEKSYGLRFILSSGEESVELSALEAIEICKGPKYV